MAKNNNAIYAPGELSRVREKLGVNDSEAKRIAQLLGGEVGTERSNETDPLKNRKSGRRENVEVLVGGKGGKRSRRIDTASFGEEGGKYKPKQNEPYPGDDPSIPAKLSYFERVKIDQYSGQLVFEVKNPMQVLVSVFSFFREPIDYVNPRFVTKRMNEYYHKIEKLVTSTRNLFPKDNLKRNNQLKRTSPFVYKILDIMRKWNIEQLAGNIAELQARPRTVKVSDFTEILKGIYRPLFILEDLNSEDIKTVFKLIYKILYIESPMEAKGKYQEIIRNIITSLSDIRQNVHFGLYPLLIKLISDRFIVYERFFIERRRRFMAFLNVTEVEQLKSEDLSPQQIENMDVETLQKNLSEEDDAETAEEPDGEPLPKEEEDLNDPKVIERKAREDTEKAERKALDQGRTILENLFPKAGWEKLEEYPDLYPYFAKLYSMKGGYELIAPTDPLQQISVLMNILDDLFIGLRLVNFGLVSMADGSSVRVGDELSDILSNWRRYIEDSFSKDYLPRLSEYCRLLENSKDARTSPYARKTMNELYWIKRLFFLPYYKFESIGPPPFPKQGIIPIYSIIRKIRKYLTAVAVGIEHGLRTGGAPAKAPCNGIQNPWETYNFQVPNPVSRHLNMLLPQEKRINATLIFFTLSTVALLDYIVNSENSWAYGNSSAPLFRSIRNEGITPLFGVDERLDAEKIFMDSLKKR